MSGTSTTRMIEAYVQEAPPVNFLTGEFQSPPRNFYNSEGVEIDIVRGEEDVSIVIQDISAGYRSNSSNLYTNKSFIPPIHKESGPINSFDLPKRNAGQNPFEDVNFQANAITRAFVMVRKNDAKIRRAIELQASQVLQTGILDLTDEAGTTLYRLDYKPKTSHFPTSGAGWAGAANKIAELTALADQIRADGLGDPDRLFFGQAAWDAFIQDSAVQALLANRRMELGSIMPERVGNGGKFMGHIWLGSYRFELWTYTGRYKHVQTGASTRYLVTGNVVMTTSTARLDATFGAIPRIVPPESRVLPFMPSRISSGPGRMDIAMTAWVTPDGEQLIVGSSSRPLLIPTAIDTYGCLTTGL